MGESLADMDKHKGERPAENWSYRGTGLKELGIGKNQSHPNPATWPIRPIRV